MIETSIIDPFVSALTTPSAARQAGELARSSESLAEQTFVFAGAGGLLGLGLGITLSGAVVYLLKRRQINNKLQS